VAEVFDSPDEGAWGLGGVGEQRGEQQVADENPTRGHLPSTRMDLAVPSESKNPSRVASVRISISSQEGTTVSHSHECFA
jgi:hypothetical protein